MPVKLSCIKGTEPGMVLIVPENGELIIGRSQTADVSVNDKMLSRKHVKVSVRDNAAFVEDLQSSNGTYLNGERLTKEIRLANTDRIKMGSHIFQVELSEGMVGATGANQGAFGTKPLPKEARRVLFCPVSYRAVAEDEAIELEGYGPVSPDVVEPQTYPEGMIEGFRLGARLGEGRMGVVFRARHLALQKDVAIKVIRSERASNEMALRRYFREAKIGGRLFHPNILEMYDAAVSNGHYYISMELVEGETLMQRIGLYGALPVEEILFYSQCAAEGLAYAHSQGVVHRDFSPACVFLGADGKVKIGDFGLARLADPEEMALTPPGETLGSLCYMAPEQLADATTVDARADVYSLGATMYHGLAGYPPFAADTVANVFENKRSGTLIPLLTARPDVHPGLATVIAQCLAEDRAARYPTADAVVQALRAIAAGQA